MSAPAEESPHTFGATGTHRRRPASGCATRARQRAVPRRKPKPRPAVRRGRLEAGLFGVADDHAAQHGADDLAQSRNRGERAEPVDARQRTLRLRHDALRRRWWLTCARCQALSWRAPGPESSPRQTRTKAAAAEIPDRRREGSRGGVAQSSVRSLTARSIGGTAKHAAVRPERGAVGAERQQSVCRHRARHGDRDLQQEDAGDRADEPRRR